MRKPIRYETHALHRMEERGVSEAEVESVLERPQVRRPARREGAFRFERAISKRRRVVVIAEETKNFWRVVSAWTI